MIWMASRSTWNGLILLLVMLLSQLQLPSFLVDSGEGFIQCEAQIIHDRMRPHDEPQLVSFRVLEGVTEPFLLDEGGDAVPAWKLMKIAADEKKRKGLFQQALHEYGQLLKHPYMFGEMPVSEKYDIFLSMANLLKKMGFHQKAELLLYEAMSYSQEPYEAHMQLGLIFLDKEDLDKAKMHMKNCLYYKESDLLVLVHMATILIAEGRIHEAKFYVTRILSALEMRVQKFSFLYENKEDKVAEALLSNNKRDYTALTTWLEDVLISVFHGEYTLPSVAVVDSLRMFSHLYEWLDDGEMNGRFVFDLGQSLYEGGRPEIGSLMMHRGLKTTNPETEGQVSVEIVKMRTSLDYPVIADSLLEVIDSYLNMSSFIHTQAHYPVDFENSLDVYWPIPYIYFSALPLSPILEGLNRRFSGGPQLTPQKKYEWMKHPQSSSISSITPIRPLSSSSPDRRIAIGIFGGHMNNHAVGQTILHRLISELRTPLFKITLIATPLVPDDMTKQIASMMHNIVNLPLDTKAAWKIINQLNIDIMLFPDWQPFPDQQALFFQSRRMAPIQICLFIRGSSCGSHSIDYYMLPDELYNHYKETSRLFWDRYGVDPFVEQVLLVDWKIFTQQSIHQMAQVALDSTDSDDAGVNEMEGRIFFEGQPVAVYAADPSYCHPLMDEVLFRVMHSCPSLQIVIAISSSFFSHDRNVVRRMKWGRKLVRRLWSRGGSVLAARIRLLPLPVNDKKLLNLLRTADLMIDPFPIGSTLHAAALALSVGTPVVTMGNGVHLQASKSDLSELRMHLHSVGKDRSLGQTWLYQTMMRSNHSGVGNIPWLPTISPIAAFYSRVDMADDLVANDTNDYFNIASRLAKDREYAYHVRVKILESVDGRAAVDKHNAAARQAAAEQAVRNGEVTPNLSSSNTKKLQRSRHIDYVAKGRNDATDNNVDDDEDYDGEGELSLSLQTLGRYWADKRIDGWKVESYM